MNAITQNAANLPNVPLGRFEPLTVSASTLAEVLQPLDDRNAKETFAQITLIQAKLQADRIAAERTLTALNEAKAAMKRINSVSSILIDTAVNVGRIFGFDDIADFANQDDAWLLTIDGLVAAFNARGDFGRQFAEKLTDVIAQARAATIELSRATDAHAAANFAYSNSYRALASAIAFGRAVLANLGVTMPRVAPAPKKKVTKAPTPSPTNTTDVAPAPAPTPMPAPVVP